MMASEMLASEMIASAHSGVEICGAGDQEPPGPCASAHHSFQGGVSSQQISCNRDGVRAWRGHVRLRVEARWPT